MVLAMAKGPKKPARTDGGKFAPGSSGNPGGKPKVRRIDAGWMNAFTGLGVYGRDKREGSSFRAATLTFDQLAELWRGDDLAARAVETMPKEALREGYDVVIPETDDEEADGQAEADRVAEVLDKLDVLGANHIIRVGLSYERGLGGGAVLIGANDGQTDLTKPLDLDKVRSLDWLTPLEPRELYPVYGYADPRAPKYGQPEIYRLTSRAILPPAGGQYSQTVFDIHESRLLVFPGQRVSRYQTMAAQGGWGDSVLVRMWRVLRDFNLAWGSAGVLVSEFAKAVYKMKDLWDTLASEDGATLFQERLGAMDMASSTINATVIDSDDDYQRTQTPIAGLPDLMDKFSTRLAASADMPLTLLFGTSPSGLNATGESDIRFFYDRVAAYQREKLLPQLTQLIKIIFRTTGDKKEPPKWNVRFKPLWQESAKDRAQAMLVSAQADAIWLDRQVVSAEEVANSHWGSGEWNPEITIDFDARENQEAAASGPVTEDDLRAMGRLDPEYQPPPPPGSFDPSDPTTPPGEPAAPDPETPPKPYVQANGDRAGKNPFRVPRTGGFRADDYDEAKHPRDEGGRWTASGAPLTHSGDETGDKEPKAGDSFVVYRLGSGKSADLGNKNAGNANAVAGHIGRAQGDGPAPAGGYGDTVTAYKVTLGDNPGKYAFMNQGRRTSGSDDEHLVGREAQKRSGGNGSVVYSFPQGGAWKAEKLGSAKVEDLTKHLQSRNTSGDYVDFDMSSTVEGGNAIREYFAKQGVRADYDENEARDPSGKWTSGGGSSPMTPTSSGSGHGPIKLSARVEAHRQAMHEFLAQHRASFAGTEAKLQEIAVPGTAVKGRVKELESALGKMERKPKYQKPGDLWDGTGFRMIAKDVAGVHANVDAIKRHFHVVEESNYIEKPQEGGYRSVHLTIKDHDGLMKEIQVRTPREDKWGDWCHDIYKPVNDSQKQTLAEHKAEIQAYAAKMSDHYYALDSGKSSEPIPCPPILHSTFGCLD